MNRREMMAAMLAAAIPIPSKTARKRYGKCVVPLEDGRKWSEAPERTGRPAYRFWVPNEVGGNFLSFGSGLSSGLIAFAKQRGLPIQVRNDFGRWVPYKG